MRHFAILILSTGALTLVIAVGPVAAESILYEQDHDRDGTTDFWFLFEDDTPTTVIVDRDRNGTADFCWVYGEFDGRFDLLQVWVDDDLSGTFNDVTIRQPDRTWKALRAGGENDPGRDFFVKNDPRAILQRPIRRAPLGAVPLDRQSKPLGLWESNEAIDGKKIPDVWRWYLHGEMHMMMSDAALDQKPEGFLFRETTADGLRVGMAWNESVPDGKFDHLTLQHPDGTHESWRGQPGWGQPFSYMKEDYNALVRTRAKTDDFRCRRLRDVTTETMLLSEVPPKYPTRNVQLREGVDATYDATGRLFYLSVRRPGLKCYLSGFLPDSRFPRSVHMYASDPHPRATLYFTDKDHDGKYEHGKAYVGGGGIVNGYDTDGDGRFDAYDITERGGRRRRETDNDGDGILDNTDPPEKCPDLPLLHLPHLPDESELKLGEREGRQP